MSILGFFRRFKRKVILDPVYKCAVHVEQNCAYVDGLVCNFPNCEIRRKYIKDKK